MTKRMPLWASLGLMLLSVGSGAVLLHQGRSEGDTTAGPPPCWVTAGLPCRSEYQRTAGPTPQRR